MVCEGGDAFIHLFSPSGSLPADGAATGGEIVEDIFGNVAGKIGWDELVHEFLLT